MNVFLTWRNFNASSTSNSVIALKGPLSCAWTVHGLLNNLKLARLISLKAVNNIRTGRLLEWGAYWNRIIAVYVTTKVKSLIDLSMKKPEQKVRTLCVLFSLIFATCSEIARALLQYPAIYTLLYLCYFVLSPQSFISQSMVDTIKRHYIWNFSTWDYVIVFKYHWCGKAENFVLCAKKHDSIQPQEFTQTRGIFPLLLKL